MDTEGQWEGVYGTRDSQEFGWFNKYRRLRAWGMTDSNRRARFYGISAAGRRQLAVEKQEWNQTVTIMRALLGGPE